MSSDAEIGTATLRHNPLNAVTATVERVTYADGRTLIRKELRNRADRTVRGPPPRIRGTGTTGAARSRSTRTTSFASNSPMRGLVLPQADVDEHADGAVLMMEDIEGTQGTEFALAEHAAFARACGRWQARPAGDRGWTSVGFLRDYSTTRDVPWELVDDDAAWRQPLIAETWPAELRTPGLTACPSQRAARAGRATAAGPVSPRPLGVERDPAADRRARLARLGFHRRRRSRRGHRQPHPRRRVRPLLAGRAAARAGRDVHRQLPRRPARSRLARRVPTTYAWR